MTSISLEVPIIGAKNTTEEPKVGNSIKKTEEFINGANIDGTTNIKAASIEEANLAAAVVTKLNQKSSGLELKKQKGSTTGESGILYEMEEAGTTITLTATATAGKQVGIFCKTAIESVKLKAGAGAKLYGGPINGLTEITVRECQTVLVEADGTNWIILNPSTELSASAVATAFVGTTFAAAHIPSKLRPAFVNVTLNVPAGQEEGVASIKVGGTEVSRLYSQANGKLTSTAILVKPGVAWEATKLEGLTGAEILTSWTLF